MKIKSNIKSRDYSPNEVVRIVNPKQYLLYIKNNVYPIDVFTSIDEKTNKAILAMVFLREETTDVYKKWCNYDLD